MRSISLARAVGDGRRIGSTRLGDRAAIRFTNSSGAYLRVASDDKLIEIYQANVYFSHNLTWENFLNHAVGSNGT